ncbi:MAG: hypothetical protein BGO69_03290 [Bacteroidetes bacterium 46-16]|nr:MAG: hypothetical protein BGO69_03290 [Bacteroidetes bacterium 46-16]
MKQILRTVVVSTLLIALLPFIGLATPCATSLLYKAENTTDCGLSDGSIIFSGVVASNTYTVDYLYNGLPQPTLTITPTTTDLIMSGLPAGDYENIVINNTSLGCNWGPFGTITVNDPIVLIDSVSSIDPATCGTNTGSIFLYGLRPNTTYTINITLNGNPQTPVTGIANGSGMIALGSMTSGAYDITVSSGTCTSNSVNINLYDPEFLPAFDYEIHLGCSGDSVFFQNQSENASSYTWDFGDNTSSTDLSPGHLYTTQGVYTVVLHVFNGSCERTITHEVTLVHPVISAFNITRDSICERQEAMFDGTPSINAYTYSWDFGDGKTDESNNPHPKHFYKEPGAYTVTLTVKDFVPCPNSSSQIITVAPFSMIFDHQDTSVCIYEPMKITGMNTAPSYVGAINYTWSPAAGLDSTNVQEPYFYAADTQSHLYIVTATTGAPFNCMLTDSVRIFAQPHVRLVNVTGDRVINYGGTTHLNADGGYYYSWIPTSGLDNPNIKDPIASPGEPTIYTVYAMNQYGGCRDSATVKVDYVNDQEFVPTAFTPNGDGKNDVFKLVNMRSQRLLQFRVYDRWGNLVFQTTDANQGWDGTYNGNVMDSGVFSYIIQVAFPDGSQKTYRGDVTLLR